MSLVMLGETPEQFWSRTPAESADLFIAHRERENRRAIQIAWETYHHMAPHLTEQGLRDLTIEKLFRTMPIAFASDVPTAESAPPDSQLPEDVRVELERRRKRKRLTRPT